MRSCAHAILQAAMHLLASELALLAAAMRFMDFPGQPPVGTQHPALKVNNLR